MDLAKKLIWDYNRKNIASPWFRRKEWAYYLVADDHKGINRQAKINLLAVKSNQHQVLDI